MKKKEKPFPIQHTPVSTKSVKTGAFWERFPGPRVRLCVVRWKAFADHCQPQIVLGYKRWEVDLFTAAAAVLLYVKTQGETHTHTYMHYLSCFLGIGREQMWVVLIHRSFWRSTMAEELYFSSRVDNMVHWKVRTCMCVHCFTTTSNEHSGTVCVIRIAQRGKIRRAQKTT